MVGTQSRTACTARQMQPFLQHIFVTSNFKTTFLLSSKETRATPENLRLLGNKNIFHRTKI